MLSRKYGQKSLSEDYQPAEPLCEQTDVDERQVAFDVLLEQYKDKPWMQERLSKFAYDVHMLTQMQPFAAINYIRHGIGYDEFLEKYAEERKLDGQDLLELLDELQDSARNYTTYEEWFGHIEEYTEQLRKQTRKQREEKTDGVALATMHHSKVGISGCLSWMPTRQ